MRREGTMQGGRDCMNGGENEGITRRDFAISATWQKSLFPSRSASLFIAQMEIAVSQLKTRLQLKKGREIVNRKREQLQTRATKSCQHKKSSRE